MTANQVKIKIFGELSAVKAEARKIESMHSIFIESQFMENDDGNGYRVYITVPVEDKSGFGYTPQESAGTNPTANKPVIEAT